MPVQEETAKGWLKPENSTGNRNCRINEYFPKDKANETGFIKFFSSRASKDAWKKLQRAFHPINDDSIVNLNTDNPKVFYQSLLNQFLKIFRLPEAESNESDNDMPSTVFPFDSKGEEIIEMFKQAVNDYKFEDLLKFEPDISSDAIMLGVDKNWVDNIPKFMSTIKKELYLIGPDQSVIYYKINEFVNSLEEFICNLKAFMVPSDNKTWILPQLENIDDSDIYMNFIVITDNRQRVKKRYEEIMQHDRELYLHTNYQIPNVFET
jgi:hypothetical protein